MILVMGLGFVGLTTALGFCEKGYTVYGYDPDKARCDMLRGGVMPFFEPGLDEALTRHLNIRFKIANDLSEALPVCSHVFFAVGTPCGENGKADLTYLEQAVGQALDHQNDGKFRVLTIKSTVPPTTVKDWLTPFVQKRGFVPGKDISVANNPEFLREGHCWEDFIAPDRIVIGSDDQRARDMLSKLYEVFDAPVYCVSANTGEYIKYLSNSLLATMISFSNEMSQVADAIGDVDIPNAFKVLHKDRRWNQAAMAGYVYPGCGYGGYCLPKDTQAIRALSSAKGFFPKLMDAVIATNDAMPAYMAKKVESVADKDQTVGVLGLSFKPGSDDVRDSAAAKVIGELMSCGYERIVAYDPVCNEKFDALYRLPIEYCASLEDIAEQGDVFVIATAWHEFERVSQVCRGKNVIDLRYML